MQNFWLTISFFGSFWWIFLVSIAIVVYLIITKKIYRAKWFAITMLMSPMISNGLKNIVREVRPINNLETGYSFPSGHALNSIVFYLLLTKIVRIKSKYIIWALIGLIGLSRILLGVHFWWDVLGGWIIGYGIYRISIKLLK